MGITLLSCAICVKIRLESLHDLEKNAFITIKQERVVLLRWGSVLRTSPSKTCHVDLCIHNFESHW